MGRIFGPSFKNFRRSLKKRLGLKRKPGSRKPFFVDLRREFDPVWYRNTYLAADDAVEQPLDHYLTQGVSAGHSPNGWFDEEFYLAFYPEVRIARNEGRILCGFQHFLQNGRAENRLTKHELQKCLEARMPNVTDPVLLHKANDLSRQLRPISAVKSARLSRTIWFLLPTLNPDIMFGGYRCVIELIKFLVERGRTVKIVGCGQESNIEYFQYHYRDALGTAFAHVELLNRHGLNRPLDIGVNDRIFAYSGWEAHLARTLASLTNEFRFAFLIQEYEPIFHEHGSEHAILSAAYELPHFAIFNSDLLRLFFQQSQLGVFRKPTSDRAGTEYIVIDHVRARMRSPTYGSMARRGGLRRLIMYSRPEQHASRNLFPMAVLGLERAIERGTLAGSWELFGVGALSSGRKLNLPAGYALYLKSKMGMEEYAEFVAGTDVGISLMYAPHPGLVAFELAEAGARVVTNAFSNRSSEYLSGVSENIISCDSTIEGIAAGIDRAVFGLDDIDSRLRGAKIPGPRSWSEVFDENFFSKMTQFI